MEEVSGKRGPAGKGGSGGGFVGLILRSPLHPLMSGSTMLIAVLGRKTGRELTLPVQYARDGDDIWVLVGNHERKTWWRNLRQEAPVRLRLRGKEVEASARALDGSREPAAMEEGLHAYLTRLPRAAKSLGVRWHSDRGLDEDDIRDAAKSAVMVRARIQRAG